MNWSNTHRPVFQADTRDVETVDTVQVTHATAVVTGDELSFLVDCHLGDDTAGFTPRACPGFATIGGL